jgi:AcrR family transcriptional regulator
VYRTVRILGAVPRLWSDTIESHRRSVRDAILDATARLVAEGGLTSVTMSAIAEASGIGRATLYKYFPDVEAILTAWHERQVSVHLAQLIAIRDRAGDARQRLVAVLEAYARLGHAGHDPSLAAALHRGPYVVRAHDELAHLIEGLVEEAAAVRAVRADVPSAELAQYCLSALSAASGLHGDAALERLMMLILAALEPAYGMP